MVTSLATAALTIYLVRALGPNSYGTFAIALSLGSLLLLPGDFGISHSTARFVAEQRGNWRTVGGLVAGAIRLKAMVALAVGGALVVLAGPIADAYNAPELGWPLRAVAIALVGQSFLELFTGVFVALGRISVTLRVVAAESLMEATASAGLVLLGGGVTGAAFGRAIGYVFGAVVGLFFVLRIIGRRNVHRGATPVGGVRQIARYAGALMIIDGAYALLGSSGVLLLGAFLDPRSVGLFQPAVRLVTFLHYPGYAISNGIAPRLARTATREPDAVALQRGIRYLLLVQTVLVAPTVVWAQPLTFIALGDGYGRTADVLAAIAPYTLLSGFAPLLSLSVNFLGEARRRVPIAIITLLLSLGLNALLIPTVGIVGSAIATDVAYAFYVVGHFWICQSLLHLPVRPILLDIARCLVAGAAMGGVMALFGTHRLGFVEIVAGGAAGVAVYVAVLLVTGAATRDELRALRNGVRRKFGRA